MRSKILTTTSNLSTDGKISSTRFRRKCPPTYYVAFASLSDVRRGRFARLSERSTSASGECFAKLGVDRIDCSIRIPHAPRSAHVQESRNRLAAAARPLVRYYADCGPVEPRNARKETFLIRQATGTEVATVASERLPDSAKPDLDSRAGA